MARHQDTCHGHLVFITKYRHRVFDGDAIKRLRCSPNSLKGVCSRILRQERPDLAARYWKGVLWSPPYFAASCGGAPINILKDYIPALKDRAFTPERVNRIRWCLPVGMQAGLTKQCCARGADCAAGSRAKPSAGHLPHSPQ